MYLHELQTPLNEGKKIKRLGWEDAYIMKAKPVSAFELDKKECEAIGVPEQTIAEPSDSCLLYVESDKVQIGHELTSEDKISQDWQLAE